MSKLRSDLVRGGLGPRWRPKLRSKLRSNLVKGGLDLLPYKISFSLLNSWPSYGSLKSQPLRSKVEVKTEIKIEVKPS